MRKLFLLLGVILTASPPEAQPAAAAGLFAGPLPSTFVSGGSRHDAVVVLVAGEGGGMSGGAMTGGMGDGATTGGMGGGAATGGMGGGSFGGGMFNNPTADFRATKSQRLAGQYRPALLLHLPMRHPQRPMLLCGAGFASRELASRRRALLLFGRTESR
jgi:hypothetical protein